MLSSKHTHVHGCQLRFRGWAVAGEPGVPCEFSANHETWQQFHRDTRTTMNCKTCTYCILTKKEQKQTEKNPSVRTAAADVWGSDTAFFFFFCKEASSHNTVIIWQSRRNHRSQKPAICLSFVLRLFFFWLVCFLGFLWGFFCRKEN